MLRKGLALIAALIALLALSSAAANAAIPSIADDPTWGAGFFGTGSAVGPDGDRAWMVGSFSMAAPRSGPGAAIDTSGGRIAAYAELTDAPAGQLRVDAAAADGSGGWYVAGNFANAGGLARPGLVHLLADGTADPGFDAQATAGTIKALLVAGGNLYVGGGFATIGGAAQPALAALDRVTGAAVGGWAPAVTGTVNALALGGGVLYAGGSFTSGARTSLIAVNPGTGVVNAAFNPDPTGGPVNAVVALGTSVYIGGQFTTVFGGATGRLVKIDVAGPALDAAWTPAPNGIVFALGTDGTALYAGGSFSTFGGAGRVGVAAVLPTGTGTATAWDPGGTNAGTTVRALSVAGGNVYIGGNFETIGAAARHSLAAVAADATATLQPWAPEPNDFVNAIAATATAVYAGGTFGGIGGRALMSLYPIDLLTGAPMAFFSHDFNSIIGNDLRAIAVCGDAVYVAGTFSAVDGVQRLNAAAFDRNTGALLPWDPGADNDVNTLACGNGVVYLGGIFNFLKFGTASQTTRNGLAAVDTAGGDPTSWDPAGVNALFVNAMALQGSTLYVGGNFANIGNPVAVARPNLAALNTADSSATGWSPVVTNTGISSIALSSNEIYIGGSITAVGATPRTRAAALRLSDASLDPGWDPAPDAAVRSLAVAPDGTVYMGGSFTLVNGQGRRSAAALSPAGGLTSWNPSPDGTVNQVAVGPDGRVYLAGGFSGTTSRATRLFATFSEPTSFATAPALTSAPVDGQPTSCDGGTAGGSLPAPQTIQWRLDGGDIAGATGTSYTPSSADVGHALSCHVSQRNLVSSAQADSASVTVAAAPAAPAVPSQSPPPFDIDGQPTPPPPVAGKSVIATPTKGTVTVLLPGFKQFIPLPDAERIPVGTVIDTRKGTVKLTTVGANGKLQSAIFYEGVFKVFQEKGRRPVVELRLVGGNFSVCPRVPRRARRADAAKVAKVAKTKSIRHLWGDGKGLFRTKGRYASATIRGTRWLTDDRCDGTLVRVAKGAVTVRDIPKKKSFALKAPKKYLAHK